MRFLLVVAAAPLSAAAQRKFFVSLVEYARASAASNPKAELIDIKKVSVADTGV